MTVPMPPLMTVPLVCLTAFALWTVLLVLVGIGPYRVGNVLMGKAKPGQFTPAIPHGPDWYQRVMRAHSNCVENLPVFAALVVVGHLTGHTDGVFGTLCQVIMAARIGQSIAHIASGRHVVINVRFAFFLTQLTCFFALGWLILH